MAILVAAAMIAAALAMGAVALALIVNLVRRASVASPGPSELGRAIGLVPIDRNDAAGEIDGVRVHARWTSVQRGSGKSRRTVRVMRYWAAIDPPLRMGLEIGREGLLDGFLDSIGVSGDIQVGDAELDGAIRIGAIDARHAAAVLVHPEVKPALLAGTRFGTFGVTDAKVAAGHDRWVTDVRALQAAIDVVQRIARTLRDARARAPAAWELALAESWGAIARTESMQWTPERSRLATRAGDAWVVLEVDVEKGALVTRLALRFDAPLGIGLAITKTGLGAQLGAMLGAQDVQCGHRAFDDAFTVKARDAETARHVLASGGADAIVRLASWTPELSVDDTGAQATFRTLLTDPRAAGQVMRAAIDLAQALRGGGRPQQEGAYR